jgi:hypothetical protein
MISPFGRILKRVVFWSYGRTTWQYDVLCVLILAFIFLTPKSWFETGEPKFVGQHQNLSVGAVKLLISPEILGPNPDRQAVERGVQLATGRSGTRIKNWEPVKGEGGQTVAYRVDIE